MPSLRLLSVNARTAEFDGQPADRHGVARLIALENPDVAVVHGAPSLARWRSACAALARECGLVVVVGGRTSGGNLILSSLGVDVDAVRELTFPGHVGPRPPGAAVAALRLRDRAFVVAGVRHGTGAGEGATVRAAATAIGGDAPVLVSEAPAPGAPALRLQELDLDRTA